MLCPESADALERGFERVTRQAGKYACDEGLQEYYEAREPFERPGE